MSDNYRSEKYFFRFYTLSHSIYNKTIEILKKRKITYETGKHFKNKKRLVIVILLNKKSRVNFFIKIVRENKLNPKQYGIYVSLITDRDNDGVSVPSNVLKIYNKLGGSFDFSFIC